MDQSTSLPALAFVVEVEAVGNLFVCISPVCHFLPNPRVNLGILHDTHMSSSCLLVNFETLELVEG